TTISATRAEVAQRPATVTSSTACTMTTYVANLIHRARRTWAVTRRPAHQNAAAPMMKTGTVNRRRLSMTRRGDAERRCPRQKSHGDIAHSVPQLTIDLHERGRGEREPDRPRIATDRGLIEPHAADRRNVMRDLTRPLGTQLHRVKQPVREIGIREAEKRPDV